MCPFVLCLTRCPPDIYSLSLHDALPIFDLRQPRIGVHHVATVLLDQGEPQGPPGGTAEAELLLAFGELGGGCQEGLPVPVPREIGRASCRERVEVSGAGVAVDRRRQRKGRTTTG